MAEKLKREFDIIVLKVELLSLPSGQSNVRFTLQCKVEGDLTDVLTQLGDTGTMGLRSRSGSGIKRVKLHAKLPAALISELRLWFMQETDGHRPLWVHLVAPYGPLRFVPWERILGEALGVPILMLPDFIFPPPRETADVLEVVLCASAPIGCEAALIYETLQKTVDRIIESEARRMRIHVFLDSWSKSDLEERWKIRGWLGKTVILHSHEMVEKYVTQDLSSHLLDSAGMLRSPWLLWMREALRGRAVDIVHFICHGYLTRDNGAILFAQSPLERTDRFLAGPVGFNELQTFLTQVGAWSTVFSSVPDNFSEIGLRALADEIAQNRPGPLMMYDVSLDGEGRSLAEAYRFLYSISRPQPPPQSTAVFIYCQPYLAPAPTSRHPPTRIRSFRSPQNIAMNELARNSVQEMSISQTDLASSPLENFFQGPDNATPLAAATERFAEQIELRYQKLARDGIFPKEIGGRHNKTAADVLDKLRNAVAARMNPTISVVSSDAPSEAHGQSATEEIL
jgi:hypothetical protein